MIQVLHVTGQNLDVPVTLEHSFLQDLKCWLSNIDLINGSPITPPASTLFSTTDASKTWRGEVYQGQRTNWRWSALKGTQHINLLEPVSQDCLRMENTTVLAPVNRKGGTRTEKHRTRMSWKCTGQPSRVTPSHPSSFSLLNWAKCLATKHDICWTSLASTALVATPPESRDRSFSPSPEQQTTSDGPSKSPKVTFNVPPITRSRVSNLQGLYQAARRRYRDAPCKLSPLNTENV